MPNPYYAGNHCRLLVSRWTKTPSPRTQRKSPGKTASTWKCFCCQKPDASEIEGASQRRGFEHRSPQAPAGTGLDLTETAGGASGSGAQSPGPTGLHGAVLPRLREGQNQDRGRQAGQTTDLPRFEPGTYSSREALLLRIGSRNSLVIIDQGSRHDARLRTQQIGSQSGHLVWLDQLPHGLRRFRFR